MPVTHAKKKIAYLTKTFPKLSETFILNEVLELERMGVELRIFSLKTPSDELHQSALGKVRTQITYVPPLQVQRTDREFADLLKRHLFLLCTCPIRYLTVLFMFVRGQIWNGPSRRKMCKLSHVLKREGFAHLHAHFANHPTSVAAVVSRLTGIPYSFTAHAKDIYLTDPAELDEKISTAQFVLTCTSFNQDYLQKISKTSTPIILAHHGIDLSLFNPGGAMAGKAADPPLILGVGRLCEKKGFHYLIEACHLLREKGYSFQCSIVGYGPLDDDLKTLINRLDLESHVSMLGKMNQDEILRVYRRARIFALPCQVTNDGDRDGIPNVLIEAIALGLPVVSTDISGIGELVDHMENGILVKQRDPAALAEAISSLLRQPELCAKSGRSGREKVLGKFSLDRNVSVVRDCLMDSVKYVIRQDRFHHAPALQCASKTEGTVQ